MQPVTPQCFLFSLIPGSAGSTAYYFHRQFASSNPHIFPRSEFEIRQFADNGELYGVRAAHSGDLVGICYAHHKLDLSNGEKEAEVGGLVVASEVGRMGIGTVLIEFALAHELAFNQPWKNGEELVGYVREGNKAPLKLLRTLGFEFVTKVRIKAPPSMACDQDGYVTGDKFRFGVEGLHRLNLALSSLHATLAKGIKAKFNLGLNTIDDLKRAIMELTNQYPKAKVGS